MSEAEEFGKKLLILQRGKGEKIKKIYYRAIVDLSGLAASLPYKKTVFNLALYPLLKRRVDYILKEMARKIESVVIDGIDQAWQLSDDKNRVFLDKNLKKYNINKKVRKTYYDSNDQAKQAFKQRAVKGIKLSDRVWNSVLPFKNTIELGLGTGIATGESAAKMASRMKKHLNEPDKLFRSVVDPDGRVRLSKAAKNYHPGQGVYRSSYKNALRLTRTETNIAYRTADYDRWNSQPFVVGVQIQLSNAHPKPDICDPLAGKYPKDFQWTGWHPQCICFMTPILITPAELDKHQDEILGIGKWDGKSVNSVDDAPPAFYKYLEKNGEDISRLKSPPYWVQDNKKYVGDLKK